MDRSDLELIRHVIESALAGTLDAEQAVSVLELIEQELNGDDDVPEVQVDDSTSDGEEAADVEPVDAN